MTIVDDPSEGDLSSAERERLAALRGATSLANLAALTGASDEGEAYFRAKCEHRDLVERALAGRPHDDGLPGDCVTIEGHDFHVHGVTHADTDAERSYLREHVSRFLERDAVVYCEQGIRQMYFEDVPPVCSMDDYRWAVARCRELDVESSLVDVSEELERLSEDVDDLSERLRESVFSLIDSGGEVYGDRFAAVLGDLATDVLTSPEDVATAENFESFALSRAAAEDPRRLVDLQRYYAAAFLPQPVEREWLRRHDRELELFTHARNERMADYAVAHNDTAEEVHLIVGAAHQPGVTHYLREHRDGRRSVEGFELAD